MVAAAVAPAALGSAGADFESRWYRGLRKPDWQPSGATIGLVWSCLYTLTAVAGVLLRRGPEQEAGRRGTVLWALFGAQSALNAAYTPLLTRRRDLVLATLDSGMLFMTVGALALTAWRRRRLAGVLLLPYVGWTAFATFLSATLVRLNRR